MSDIVLSQQCCEVYFISHKVAKPIWDVTTKYHWNRPPPITLLAGSAPAFGRCCLHQYLPTLIWGLCSNCDIYHRRGQGAMVPPKFEPILFSNFVLWEAVSQTKCCCSPTVNILSLQKFPPKKILSWLWHWYLPFWCHRGKRGEVILRQSWVCVSGVL